MVTLRRASHYRYGPGAVPGSIKVSPKGCVLLAAAIAGAVVLFGLLVA